MPAVALEPMAHGLDLCAHSSNVLLRPRLLPSAQFATNLQYLVNTTGAHRMLQFPEARLIEYDCGKLQALTKLLRRLLGGRHRALIFTQMTRVLDILEAYLSCHDYQSLRLDGPTKVEVRQTLIEQFNADSKTFCVILSTRSGGTGVNLTDADTVIFCDSD